MVIYERYSEINIFFAVQIHPEQVK